MLVAALALCAPVARAAPHRGADPATCLPALDAAQRQDGKPGDNKQGGDTPADLLRTIAVIESVRTDPATGRVTPWAWTINVNGVGYAYDTKAGAVDAVRILQAVGVASIDVGCMQVNLAFHPNAFPTLDQAFDPQANVAYAARFLRALFVQTGSWPKAAAAYHSQTPNIGADYERRVMALWPLAPAYADDRKPAPEPSAADRNRLPGFQAWLQRNARDVGALAAAHRPGPPSSSSPDDGRGCFVCQARSAGSTAEPSP